MIDYMRRLKSFYFVFHFCSYGRDGYPSTSDDSGDGDADGEDKEDASL